MHGAGSGILRNKRRIKGVPLEGRHAFFVYAAVRAGTPSVPAPAGGIEIVPHGAAHEPQLPPDDGGLDQQLRRGLMHHEILHDAGAILPCVHAGVAVHEADVRRVAAVQRPLAKIIAESGVAHALGVKGQQAQAAPPVGVMPDSAAGRVHVKGCTGARSFAPAAPQPVRRSRHSAAVYDKRLTTPSRHSLCVSGFFTGSPPFSPETSGRTAAHGRPASSGRPPPSPAGGRRCQ